MTEAHKTDNYWNNFKKPYPVDIFLQSLYETLRCQWFDFAIENWKNLDYSSRP